MTEVTEVERAIDAAARSLIEDPSFASMRPGEQQAEAAAALVREGLAQPSAEVISDCIALLALLAPPEYTPQPGRRHIPPGRPTPITAEPTRTPQTPVAPPRAPTRTPQKKRVPILYEMKALTGMSDAELAKLLDMTRASVQSYVTGRNPEVLKETHRSILREYLQLHIEGVQALLENLR